MTEGGTVAMAHWRRLDTEGTDRCTLSRVEHGWMLSGQAHWRQEETELRLTYLVRCTFDWHSLSADITGTRGDETIGLRILRGEDGWLLNDEPQPVSERCIDLDLGFTPATNLIPIRRMRRPGHVDAAVCWLPDTLDRLQSRDQRYARVSDNTVAYSCAETGASDLLEVHHTGMVIRYPGLWDGWVDE